MREKLKYIDWWLYFKFVGIFSGIVFFAKLSPSKDSNVSWLFVIGFTFFIMLFFLFKGLVEVSILLERQKLLHRTKTQVLMENRKKKLKRLNSKWLKLKLLFAKKKKTGSFFSLIKGQKYLYNKLFDMEFFYRISISDNQDIYLVQNDFDEYFYNIKEIRREKLKKIFKQE